MHAYAGAVRTTAYKMGPFCVLVWLDAILPMRLQHLAERGYQGPTLACIFLRILYSREGNALWLAAFTIASRAHLFCDNLSYSACRMGF